MRRLPFLLLLAACGGEPIPEVDLLLRVKTPEREVVLGRAFPLEVVRVWPRGLEPVPWSGRVLAPLALEEEGSTRREDGERVEETFRYRAYAFALDEVTVPAPRLVVRSAAGAPERTVMGDALLLRVRRALDPKAPGAPELPGDPPPPAVPWGLAAAALVLVAAAAVLLARRRRRPAPVAAAPGPPPPSPEERALAGLEALRLLDDARALLEAPDVLRGYLRERFGVPAAHRTTQELLTEARLAARARALLADVLVPCDLVKFAARPPGDSSDVLDAASTFVKEAAA